jgi:hypothetical protein
MHASEYLMMMHDVNCVQQDHTRTEESESQESSGLG